MLVLCSALLLCGWLSQPLSASAGQSSSFLKSTIVSLSKARDSIYEEQFLGVLGGEGSARSKEDVSLFISYLDGRIYHYCRELYLSGGPGSLAGLPCPLGGQGDLETTQFGSVPEMSGQTSQEKVTQLDHDLSSALGEFDDMLLKEQEKVAAHIPRQRESGSSSAAGGGSSGSSGGEYGGEGQAAGMDQSAGGASQEAGDAEAGSFPQTGDEVKTFGKGSSGQSKLPPTAGREPKDLSQEDDDIVARQLREAAEQETDPEVKEKLWEEYRKYKEGIR